MNDICRQFDSLIARSDQLSTSETASLEAHLAGCESCRELARVMNPVNEDVAFAATNASEPAADVDAGAARDHLPDVAADRYRINGEVGRGGIGRVMRAQDRVLDRPVALKELFLANDGMRKRFVREALITARLQHPSIVPVYDAGQLAGRSPFYAMKLVAGRPLDKSIADTSTLAQRLALVPTVLAIADAIAYAHHERIIHRDLKPANVLVGAYGETIVIDWGLAKDLAIDDADALDAGPYRAAGLDHTVAGTLLGTPAYMAPEQAAGEPVDERVDVYALGAILYHVICGTAPHEGTTLEEMVRFVVRGDVRPLPERAPDVPRDLAAIVTKAMARDASERYANAQGLADDLRRYLTGQLVASHTYGTRELLRRWVKRHRAAVTVALAAVVVLGAVGIASVMRIVSARHQADEAATLATKERNGAIEMLAEMLTEQGRQELLAGRPSRAAVYLSRAQAQSRAPTIALRSLLADAMRSVDAQQKTLEPHGGELLAAAFSPDGTRIVTAADADDPRVKVWDAATGTLVATLIGHVHAPTSASFSPDNTRVLTTSRDGTARVWDARTGKELATLDHPDKVWSATYSPDGTRVVTTGKDRTVRLWDPSTARLVASLEHGGDVHSAAFSADGARIVTASADRTAKVWDAKTGALLGSLEGHRDDVDPAVFSPDGSQIATASDDGTARLWDAQTRTLRASLEGHRGPVTLVAYSPDSTRVVTASNDHTARLWDAQTGKLLTSLDGHAAEVHSAAFSPDGKRVVTASYDHTAKLWDVQTGRLLASFEGHRDDVRTAIFSPTGTQILTASADGTARLWDATPSHLRMSLDGAFRSAKLLRDGPRIVTIAEGDHTAKIWDVRSGKLVVSLDGHRGEIVSLELDPGGTRVVTASLDHTAKVWDATTGKVLVSFPHDDVVRAARISPDGARVVTSSVDPGVRIWNANTGELIARLDGSERPHLFPVPDRVMSAAFSADGARVVTSSVDGTARIWRTDNGAFVAQLDGHDGVVYSAVFSHDGSRVVTASQDHTAKVWDAGTGKLLASLDGHTGDVYRARFSVDGARVATASHDRTAKLWDARTGKLLVSLDGHTADVLVATFSPDADGARVVTTSADRTAKLWEAQTGKLLATLDGRTGELLDTAFSPDGTHLTTASGDGTIWLWDVHLETRPPDAIQHIVGARAPWTLSNSGLVPVVADATSAKVAAPAGTTSDTRAASPKASPSSAAAPASGAVTSIDDYTTRIVALLREQIDLFQETDCDKLAADFTSFLHANEAQLSALSAWRKTHTVDRSAVDKALAPLKRDLEREAPSIAKCAHNKAFAAASAAAQVLFRK